MYMQSTSTLSYCNVTINVLFSEFVNSSVSLHFKKLTHKTVHKINYLEGKLVYQFPVRIATGSCSGLHNAMVT